MYSNAGISEFVSCVVYASTLFVSQVVFVVFIVSAGRTDSVVSFTFRTSEHGIGPILNVVNYSEIVYYR